VEVIEFSADKGRVEPGERLLVSVVLRNTGGLEGRGDLTLLVEGEPVATGDFVAPPGRETVESFSLTLSSPGAHLISLLASGAEVKVGPVDIEVVSAGILALSDVTAVPAVVDLGDLTLVTVTVLNTGGTQGKGDVQIAIGGTHLGTVAVDLAPGASQDVTLSVKPPRGGTQPILATLSSGSTEAMGSVVVRAPALEHLTGLYHEQFCVSQIKYTVSFDNTGDGSARATQVTAIVFDATGAEHSRQVIEVGEILAGAHKDVEVSPPAAKLSCPEKRTYTLRVMIAPKYGDPIAIDAGPFTI
jgi:hypothetical protein